MTELSIISASIKPKLFYQDYVSKRLPVKISNHIIDKQWKGKLWTNDYLRDKSGLDKIRVEKRKNSKERFGKGCEEIISFNEFLDIIENKDDTRYLTTQELDYTEEGMPSLCSNPINSLIGDFPWIPSLCGHLIPQNVNLWMGYSKESSSSGLHHDFHDNLYILLRGEKKFKLCSPNYAKSMYTVGEIVKIHSNGRINYKGQLTNADGCDAATYLAKEASLAVEKAATLLNDNVDCNEDGEEELDDALEALLDAEIDNNDDEDNDYSDDDEGEEGDGVFGFEDYDEEDDDDIGEKKNELGIENIINNNIKSSNSSSKRILKEEKQKDNKKMKKEINTTDIGPSNFSQVDASIYSSDEIKQKFPLFSEIETNSFEVTIKAGEMLYLPAGK
jgi:hypothetical protein